MDEAIRWRIGLLIPSSNRCTEPQFNGMVPAGVAVHVQRLRLRGPWHEPLRRMEERIRAGAAILADAKPDVIVFHCTASSMEEGLEGDAWIREVIAAAAGGAGRRVVSTGQAVIAALQELKAERIELFSPYTEEITATELPFLAGAGLVVASHHSMNLRESDEYVAVEPEEWFRFVVDRHEPGVDACFVSCTNIRVIRVIERLEAALGCPVVTSNQAALWYALPPELRAQVREPLGTLFRGPRQAG